jgi:hypothetical protein
MVNNNTSVKQGCPVEKNIMLEMTRIIFWNLFAGGK